jgi:hypothetical protein
LGEEVGGFNEDVELAVCGAGDGGGGGEDGVEGVADGVVEGGFGEFAGEEMVTEGVAGAVAVFAGGWGLGGVEDG